MIFRLYHETFGGHVQCKLFSGPHDGALGQRGNFTMRSEEFAVYVALHKDAVQFRPELANVLPVYVVALDQDEVNNLADLCVGLPEARRFLEKIEKYRSR